MKAEPESPLFACDAHGIGESLPGTCGTDPNSPYGSDSFYAIHGLMLDRPYLSQRALDILRVVEWLRQ